MEDNNRNLILAMVLSMVVVLVWFTFFAPEPPPVEEQQASTETTQPAAVAPDAASGTAPAAATGPQDPSGSAGRIGIESPSLEGSISLAGGRIDDLLLTSYRETLDPESPFVRLLTPTDASYLQPESAGTPIAPGGNPELTLQKPYYAVYGWSPGAGTDPAAVPNASTIWQVEQGETLTPDSPVTLVWDNGQGQIFRRVFSLDEKYMFTVNQSVENTTDRPFVAAPYGIIARHGQPDTQNFFVLHEGMVAMTDGDLHTTKYKNIVDLDNVPREGRAELLNVTENGWIGFTDKYWMTTLAPAPGTNFTAVTKYAEGADIYQTETRFPVETVAPGQSVSRESYLFAGAKEWEAIRNYEENPSIQRFVDSIDWGWFYFLTKPIFRVLHWLNNHIGNMGWSIIALTFILKAIVFPLARKSYISMARMRELQPQMEALKERVGDDRAKMQQEMMALYKKEKVNPAAGCLPILIQIPIFFSLYKVIFVTLELRQAPWVGWIRDLSAPDPSSILNLFGLLPYAAPARDSLVGIISLSIMAIILGISMWLQQKLNPAPADPTQKMIFAWMPWIFMFMLGGFASGLVLYWITNNVITIGQQYAIMSMHGHPPNLFGNIRESIPKRKKK
ncbi:membrane protein insertase YidC [Paracoccus aerodenitrificans]|uniref:membrane protein insertase YidC n=1 Tax=Paracoccus aerodenitrificans TaxID=3017781 RepID=UPI0022F07013|nr:membrane protein insertase YidC [Paracoccus aerodenitrificans]WBU64919.1 membrane protein insertase YidC [Paracoccus aerodenitrificans]